MIRHPEIRKITAVIVRHYDSACQVYLHMRGSLEKETEIEEFPIQASVYSIHYFRNISISEISPVRGIYHIVGIIHIDILYITGLGVIVHACHFLLRICGDLLSGLENSVSNISVIAVYRTPCLSHQFGNAFGLRHLKNLVSCISDVPSYRKSQISYCLII